MKNAPIDSQEFNRIKKRIYGGYVKEYNDTADIARMFLADFFKEINMIFNPIPLHYITLKL